MTAATAANRIGADRPYLNAWYILVQESKQVVKETKVHFKEG